MEKGIILRAASSRLMFFDPSNRETSQYSLEWLRELELWEDDARSSIHPQYNNMEPEVCMLGTKCS